MMRNCRGFFVSLCVGGIVASVLAGTSQGADTAANAGNAAEASQIDYLRDVKPLLMQKCASCHGALKQKGGLRLDAISLLRKGGDNGPLFVPGKPAESLLLHSVRGTGDAVRMPFEAEPLKPEQVTILERWIAQGALAPEEKVPADPSQHWSYQRPMRAAVPQVANKTWVKNPIDAFIAARHEQGGVTPRPAADKATWLRRVYLDLTGLPPLPEELQAFLKDESAQAEERVVDKLLSSPRYGERWGRHWMDIWRYSDWAGWGQQVRDSQPHIWRWRDWIVESLNKDAPYDRMLIAMLAADEAEPENEEALRATGFLVRNFKLLSRETWMQDTVNHTTKAFLATTMECARCHDHMYDPIAQTEYYQLRAIFEPHHVRIDQIRGELDTKRDGLPRVYDADPAAATYFFVRGDDRNPIKEKPLSPAVPAILGGQFAVAPVELPLAATHPGLREIIQQETLKRAEAEIQERQKEHPALKAKLQEATAKRDAALASLTKTPDATKADPTKSDPTKADAARSTTAKSAAENAQLDALLDVDVSSKSEKKLAADAPKLDPAKPAGGQTAGGQSAEGKSAAGQPSAGPAAASGVDPELEKAVTLAQLALALHEARLKAAEANKASLQARFAADLAKSQPSTQAEESVRLGKAASLAERTLALHRAEEALAQSQVTLTEARFKAKPAQPATQTAVTAAEKEVEKQTKGVEAAQAALKTEAATYTALSPAYPRQSTGRRLAFAKWVASPENPRTARVAINHIWNRHFGQPLVASLFDFGINGTPPTHPELLDWLAVELMEHQWSMKHIHRLIVLSSTYRQSSNFDAGSAARDPDNRLVWRYPSRRAEAEVVRDAILHIAGQLDLTMGGPEQDHVNWLASRRRSLYFRHAQEKQMTFMKIFDAAAVTECYDRKESIIPQQALALANSELSLHNARLLARALHANSQFHDPSAYIQASYERILARPARTDEMALCLDFLTQQEKLYQEKKATLGVSSPQLSDATRPAADPQLRARENLVHVLLNHHEFVTIR